MSHPGEISELLRRRISRMRRRIRLRSTAPPSAFFTLMPKRLRGPPLARKKTTNCAEDFRAARENACGAPAEVLNGREAMTTLLTARCQDSAAPFGFHSGAEAMGFMAPAHFGLKGAFGQRCSSQQAPIPTRTRHARGCSRCVRHCEPAKRLV